MGAAHAGAATGGGAAAAAEAAGRAAQAAASTAAAAAAAGIPNHTTFIIVRFDETDLRCSCLSSNTTACCEHPFFSGHVTRAMFFLWRWVRDVSTSAVGTGAEGGDGAPAAAAAAPDHGQHGGCTPKPPDQHVTPVFINA